MQPAWRISHRYNPDRPDLSTVTRAAIDELHEQVRDVRRSLQARQMGGAGSLKRAGATSRVRPGRRRSECNDIHVEEQPASLTHDARAPVDRLAKGEL